MYDDHRRIVEFGGKSCQDAHINYDIICKELQAILEMCHAFKVHLARAKRVIVYVDNKSAVSFLNKEEKCHNDRAFRLVTRIRMFQNLEFTRVDTKENPADAPSRLVNWEEIANIIQCPDTTKLQKYPIHPFEVAENIQLKYFLSDGKDNIQQNTFVEPNSENTIPFDGKFSATEVANLAEHYKIVDNWSQIIQDVKYENDEDEVVYENLVLLLADVNEQIDNSQELAKAVHEKYGPHCGMNRLHKILKFIHPETNFTRKMCEEIVSKCPVCASTRMELPKNSVSNRRLAQHPLDIVSIDHFTYTTVRDHKGYTSILSMRDEFSRFVVLFPVYTHSISEVIHNLRLFINFCGIPNIIHFDNFFDSKDMNEFLESEGIEPSTSPAYRAAANGLVERVHSDLRKSIPLIMDERNINIQNWSQAIHIAASYINFAECRSTKFAPMMLMRGYLPNEYFPSTYPLKDMEQMWKTALENSKKAREKNLSIPNPKKGIFKLLPVGTPVQIFLGPAGKTVVKAIVLSDNGASVRIKKLGRKANRFNIITVHKSRVARLIDEPIQSIESVNSAISFQRLFETS